jgi:hypothetical protein
MTGDEGQHDRCLVIGIEVGPVHGNFDIFPRADHLPVILPISRMKSSFITAGILFLVGSFGGITSNSASAVLLSASKRSSGSSW